MKELPFFVMPMDALTHIAEELEIEMGDERAAEIMRRYGEKSGMGIISRLGISSTLEDLADNLPVLWAESGLTSLKVLEAGTDGVVVELADIPDLDETSFAFVQGYLAGVLSLLLGDRYVPGMAKEEGGRFIQRMVQGEEITEKLPERDAEEDTEEIDGVDSGVAYLLVNEDKEHAYEMFAALAKGREAMAITREFPGRLKRRYDIGDIPVIWLTFDRSVPFAREPGNVPLIYNDIKNFVLRNHGSVILLTGIEYLVSQTSFERVLKFIQLANDKMAITDSILLVTIAPGTIPEIDLNMLKRELQVIE